MSIKVNKVIKDNKTSLIIIGVLWVILAIILVSPIAYSIVESINNGIFDFSIFIEQILTNVTSFNTFPKIFGKKYISVFFKVMAYYSIFYIIFAIVGFFKLKAKSDYKDIEHGSSDWCEARRAI